MARKVNPAAQKLVMDRIIEAGIKAISVEGIDQISVQSVSDAAQTSRPTFYSYFGDTYGLLAEIWLAKSDEWLNSLIAFDKPVSKLRSNERVIHRAMSEILAASHRIPELQELVEPKVNAWWESLDLKTEVAQLKLMWVMAERLGVTITDPVDKNVHQAAFIEPVIFAISDSSKVKVPKGELPPLSEPEVIAENIDNKLLQSTIEVISTGGVKSASMARVARRTQVSTGAVYPRFSKIENLIESSFEVAVNKIVEQNFSLLKKPSFEAFDFGAFVMAGLLPSRKVWRNFRIEIHLGARIRPNLAKRMADNLKATNQAVSSKLGVFPVPDLVAGPIPYLAHAVGIGLAIMQNAGMKVGSVDHRLIAIELANGTLSASK